MSHASDAQPSLLPLAFSAALIALAVAFSVEAEALDNRSNSSTLTPQIAPATPAHSYEPPTLAPSAIVLNAVPAYRIEQGMVKFFFAPSKTDVPANVESALTEVIAAVNSGQRVQISGYHDTTGNPQINVELARKRALAVQQRLIKFGVPVGAIDLKKPAIATDGSSNHAEARRVEVLLIQ